MIRLSTIGPPSIRIGETRVSPANHQAFSALLYLTAERGNVIPRKVLAGMFFPARNGKGGHSVRQLLYRLRQLGAAIPADHTTVLLPRDAATWDVEELLLRGVAGEAELAALSRGYLTEFAPSHSEQFSRWLDEHRAQVTAKIRNLLINQVKTERSNRRYPALERVARACLALDPLNEEATLASAESLAMAGAKAEAVQLLDQYVDEIGPRSADLRVAPRILRGRISEYIAEPDREPIALVGREKELAILTETLNQSASGSTRACIVTGPSGIGKTRLLEEACRMAALAGQSVVRARLHHHDAKRPFAMLRDLGPALLDLPGSIGASAEALAALRGLCGRGPSQYRHMPSGAFETQAVVAEVQSRVIEVIDAVIDEQPLVIYIEDAHWIDDASLQLIGEIMNDRRSIGVLIASQRPLALPSAMESHPAVIQVPLRPLSGEQSVALLQHLVGRVERPADARFVESASRAAGGVPFYLTLLYHTYRSTGDPDALPPTLSESLATRLDQLTELTRGVFDAVVILGPYSSEIRLERVTQHPRHALVQAFRRLEEDGFVRVSDGIIGPVHDLLSTAAHRRMPPSVARLLHRAVAECLEAEEGTDIEPLAIASHWEACGADNRALFVLAASAKEYARLGRPRDSIDLLERAHRLAHTLTAQREVDILLFEMCEAAGADTKGVEVAKRLGLYDDDAAADQQLVALEFLIRAGEDMVPFKKHFERLAGDRSLAANLRARSARLLAILAEDLADRALGLRALELIADLDGDDCEVLVVKIINETVFGSADSAVQLGDRVYEKGAEIVAASQRVKVMSIAGLAMWRCGNATQALLYCEAAYSIAKATKVWGSCIGYASILADLNWTIGAEKRSREWFTIASEHVRQSPPDRGFTYLGVGILLALDANDPETASALLDEAEQRFPRVTKNRMRLDGLAYRIRIGLTRGLSPSAADVQELVEGHVARRNQGLHDLIADTVAWALECAGKPEVATHYCDQYLRQLRKDRFPIAPSYVRLSKASSAFKGEAIMRPDPG